MLMNSSMTAAARVASVSIAAAAVLAGCTSPGGSNSFASHDTTVEYYRVFDIKTTASAETVAKAATDGLGRNIKEAQVSTPSGVQVTDLPGHFKIVDPTSVPPGTAVDKGPSCDGAAWTAKATPKVRGSDNMNMVACLFPYKNGYHLDMYAVFTKPEGGWLSWPRRVGGMVMGTPEKFTETTMMDLVRAIREGTNANVSLVEAKPNLAGTPWLEPGKESTKVSVLQQVSAPAAPPATTSAVAPTSAPTSASPATTTTTITTTPVTSGGQGSSGSTAQADTKPGDTK
jgi:hypothetical protein